MCFTGASACAKSALPGRLIFGRGPWNGALTCAGYRCYWIGQRLPTSVRIPSVLRAIGNLERPKSASGEIAGLRPRNSHCTADPCVCRLPFFEVAMPTLVPNPPRTYANELATPGDARARPGPAHLSVTHAAGLASTGRCKTLCTMPLLRARPSRQFLRRRDRHPGQGQ